MHEIRSDSAVSAGIQVDIDYSYHCTYCFGTFHALCCLYFSVLRHIKLNNMSSYPHHQNRAYIYIGSVQCVGQNTWLYLQTVLFLCSFLLFDKSGLETRVCCKKAFVLFIERAHTRDSTRVATRVHITIIERTPGIIIQFVCY